MTVAEQLRLCIVRIRTDLARSALPAVGIGWAAMAMTLLSAYSETLAHSFSSQLRSIGDEAVYLFPGMQLSQDGREAGSRPVLFENSDIAKPERLGAVRKSSAEVYAGLREVRGAAAREPIWLFGVGADTAPMRGFRVALGRSLTSLDVRNAERVIFLGSETADRLFDGSNPVGRSVQIDSHRFRVVGVAAEKGDGLLQIGPPDDSIAMVPITTAQRLLLESRTVEYITIAPDVPDRSSLATRMTRELYGLLHGVRPDDESAFTVFDIQDGLRTLDTLAGALRVLIFAAGGLILLLSMLNTAGLMNALVRERELELAIEKALGARDSVIRRELLLEFVVVTVVPGTLGTLSGALLALAFNCWGGGCAAGLGTPVLRAESLAIQLFLLLGVSLVAGALPARTAASALPAAVFRSA